MLPCKGCAYRCDIPGDAHSRCVFDWIGNPKLVMPHNTSKNLRRTQQWFLFPFNYDPVWGPDDCTGRSETCDPEKVAPAHPLLDLISMLR